MTVLHHLTLAASNVPNPGHGQAPPGGEHALTLLKWVAWAVFAACVAGVLVAGGRLAIAHQRGMGGGEHASGLGWTLVGCIIAGSASAIVGALT